MKATKETKIIVQVQSEPCQKILTDLVANFYTLYTKLWNFHINYVWQDFKEKHELLWEYKDEIWSQIDMLAEELRKRWLTSQFSMQEFLSLTKIWESQWGWIVWIECFEEILSDFEKIASALDKSSTMAWEHWKLDTQQLLLDIKISHNKIRWFIRSILWQQ